MRHETAYTMSSVARYFYFATIFPLSVLCIALGSLLKLSQQNRVTSLGEHGVLHRSTPLGQGGWRWRMSVMGEKESSESEIVVG